jgi:hypothetical protein
MDAILLAADASSPDDVWVVGSSDPFGRSTAGLVLHWDGVHWEQEKIEGIAHLYDVATIAPDDAWALGSPNDIDHDDDWLVHWDGRRWSREEHSLEWELVNPSAIAAVGTDDVWLVGTDFGVGGARAGPYIAHWDGVSWSRSKVNVQSGLLEAVSAFSADSVWAAGYAALDEFDQETGSVVLRWNGNEWLQVATPDDFDGPDNITATGRDEVWVIQDYFAGERSPLWRWDGATWTYEGAPFDISVMTAFDGTLWAAGSIPSSVKIARLGDSDWDHASIAGSKSLAASELDAFPGLVAVSETTAWGVGREPVASRAWIE